MTPRSVAVGCWLLVALILHNRRRDATPTIYSMALGKQAGGDEMSYLECCLSVCLLYQQCRPTVLIALFAINSVLEQHLHLLHQAPLSAELFRIDNNKGNFRPC
jgi:hypothetical protein